MRQGQCNRFGSAGLRRVTSPSGTNGRPCCQSGLFGSLAPPKIFPVPEPVGNTKGKYQADEAASPYLFFNIFRKNGAVLLILLFATSSGEPVATTSPPNSPASGPISIR